MSPQQNTRGLMAYLIVNQLKVKKKMMTPKTGLTKRSLLASGSQPGLKHPSSSKFSLAQATLGDNPSSSDPTEFPALDKALKAEEDLARIEHYLHSLQLPPDLDDKASARLLQ